MNVGDKSLLKSEWNFLIHYRENADHMLMQTSFVHGIKRESHTI